MIPCGCELCKAYIKAIRIPLKCGCGDGKLCPAAKAGLKLLHRRDK